MLLRSLVLILTIDGYVLEIKAMCDSDSVVLIQ